MWICPATEAPCPASTDISSAAKHAGKTQSKDLPWKLFASSGKPFAWVKWLTSQKEPPAQHIPIQFMLAFCSLPYTPSFPSMSFRPLLLQPSLHCLARGLAVGILCGSLSHKAPSCSKVPPQKTRGKQQWGREDMQWNGLGSKWGWAPLVSPTTSSARGLN